MMCSYQPLGITSFIQQEIQLSYLVKNKAQENVIAPERTANALFSHLHLLQQMAPEVLTSSSVGKFMKRKVIEHFRKKGYERLFKG
ncbi:MAG: hypothetical protein H7X94_15085 [Vallitaleaceae bacterium]|nr:hypothetical protein [Vallitaleaceae bacterium]